VLLHGFPSRLIRLEGPARTGGPGTPSSPRTSSASDSRRSRGDHDYTLHWQTDMVEELVHRRGAGTEVFLVAHDMGTSVANELMARDLEGSLEMELTGGLLLNGSMVQHAASPTFGQRILRSAVGGLFSRLSTERFFRQQFGSIFSPGHPLTDDEAETSGSWSCAGGGRTLNHKTIRYMEERFKHADRWHGRFGIGRSRCRWPGGCWTRWPPSRSWTLCWSCAPLVPLTSLRGPRPLPADRGSRSRRGRPAGGSRRLNEPLDHPNHRRYTVALRPDRRDLDYVGAGSFFAV